MLFKHEQFAYSRSNEFLIFEMHSNRQLTGYKTTQGRNFQVEVFESYKHFTKGYLADFSRIFSSFSNLFEFFAKADVLIMIF